MNNEGWTDWRLKCYFIIRFYEATVEGRNLRSSAGLVDEEEDESGEEEAEEGKDYSWKKTIMIGPSYQVKLPVTTLISPL